jgi:tetratricopeptide (TPR) repeat protein
MTDESIFSDGLNRSLRHRAFFQTATHYADGSAEYRAMVAGLLVLRLLDKWPASHPATERDHKAWARDVRPVQRALAHVDDASLQRALLSLVESINNFSYGQFDTRTTQLIVCAQFLEERGYWEPAADTYATAIALIDPSGRDADLLPMCYALAARCLRQSAHPREALELTSTGMSVVGRQNDPETAHQREYWLSRLRVGMAMVTGDLLAQEHEWNAAADVFRGTITLLRARALEKDDLLICHERAAYCLRHIGRQDEAAGLLRAAIETANELQDIRWSLYLRISLAAMAREKGDLLAAETALDAITVAARTANDRDILGRALHERGILAHESNQLRRGLVFLREAAAAYPDHRMQRRALTDVAMVLGVLGEIDCARNAYHMLLNAADIDLDTRLTASLNLMEIAERSGDRVEFDRYRAEIANEPMSGRQRMYYCLVTAHGLQKFGETPAARAAYEDAVALAKQYQVYHPLLIETEAVVLHPFTTFT